MGDGIAKEHVAKNDERGADDDPEIESEGPLFDIAQVELGVLGEVRVGASVELPKPGETLGDNFTLSKFIGELSDFGGKSWARPDEAH